MNLNFKKASSNPCIHPPSSPCFLGIGSSCVKCEGEYTDVLSSSWSLGRHFWGRYCCWYPGQQYHTTLLLGAVQEQLSVPPPVWQRHALIGNGMLLLWTVPWNVMEYLMTQQAEAGLTVDPFTWNFSSIFPLFWPSKLGTKPSSCHMLVKPTPADVERSWFSLKISEAQAEYRFNILCPFGNGMFQTQTQW